MSTTEQVTGRPKKRFADMVKSDCLNLGFNLHQATEMAQDVWCVREDVWRRTIVKMPIHFVLQRRPSNKSKFKVISYECLMESSTLDSVSRSRKTTIISNFSMNVKRFVDFQMRRWQLSSSSSSGAVPLKRHLYNLMPLWIVLCSLPRWVETKIMWRGWTSEGRSV